MSCRAKNNNTVVILVDDVPIALTASQELVVAGTVQIARNSETAVAFPDPLSTEETTYIVPPSEGAPTP